MPSPLTHIMLVKKACDSLAEYIDCTEYTNAIDIIFAKYSAELCAGSISPDMTYFTEKLATKVLSSLTQDDIHFIADVIHLNNASMLLFEAINMLRASKTTMDKDIYDALFAFLCGYAAHIIADGVIHPYVRDKVGDYTTDEAKFNHRLLEMRLDVLVCMQEFGLNLNFTEIQDELDGLKYRNELFAFIADATNNAYAPVIASKINRKLSSKDFENSFESAKKSFEISSHREDIPLPWLNHLLEFKALKHEDFSDSVINSPEVRELTTPKDFKGKQIHENFMGKAKVDYINDVLPKFDQVYLPIVENLYKHLYCDKELVLSNFEPISLDDGRPLKTPESKPFYWEE